MKESKLVIYEPNRYVKMKFFSLVKFMLSNIILSADLGWRLFLRDLKAKYTQQVFGVLWIILSPFIAVVSYALLARASILNIGGIKAPYLLYAFLGVTLWGVLQGLVISGANIINTSQSFIIQIYFPREALIISPLFTSLIDLLIRLILFVILCFIYGYHIHPFNALYIFAIVPSFFFGIGLGMLASVIGAVMKDISIIIGYLFQFLLFVTPVMYSLPENTIIGTIAEYNPFYYLVTVPRDLLLFGYTDQVRPFLVCTVVSIFIFFICWRFYNISVSRIVEKI